MTGSTTFHTVGILVVLATAWGCSDPPTAIHTPTSLEVAPTSLTLDQGASFSIAAQVLDQDGAVIVGSEFQYASDNPAVATIDDNGRITSVGPHGTAVVTVTAASLSATVNVIVNQQATTITLAQTTVALQPGATWTLQATVFDFVGEIITGAAVTFTSSSSIVASVDPTGVVTGIGVGDATVAAASGSATTSAAVSVTAPVQALLTGGPFGIDITPSGVAYITQISGDAVARMDLPSLAVQHALDLGSTPAHVAFAPDGTRAYVTLQFGKAVAEVDVASNTEVGRLALGDEGFNLAVSGDGQTVYATTGGGRVDFVDAATLAITDYVQLDPVANGLAEHPSAPFLYVGSRNGGTLSEINTATRTLTRAFTVGGEPQRVAITPDGSTVFVANEVNGVDVVEVTTGTVKSPIDVGGDGLGLAMTADGSLLYVSLPSRGRVKVIDVATRTVIGSFPVGGTPRNIAISDQNGLVLVANQDGWIDVLRR